MNLFWMWIISMFLMVFGAGVFLAHMEVSPGSKLKEWEKGLLWLSLFCFIFACPLRLTIMTSTSNSIIIDKTGEIAETFDGYALLWSWDKRLEDANLVSLVSNEGARGTLTMHVSPITENPKVRELHYRVTVVAGGRGREQSTRNFFMKYGEAPYRRTIIGIRNFNAESSKDMRYILYEFNEANSKELAKFYNPASEIQQHDFQALIRTWTREYLDERGISIIEAEFSLP